MFPVKRFLYQILLHYAIFSVSVFNLNLVLKVLFFIPSAFPMNVIALLPYMVEHYESPNKTCTEAAEYISQVLTRVKN